MMDEETVASLQGSMLATDYILMELAVSLLNASPNARDEAKRVFERVSARIDELPPEMQQKIAVGEARASVATFFHVLDERLGR
jgi:hypothetical protein